MRDQPRLQDGRPPHLLHQPHAHQHEQAEEHQGQVELPIASILCTALGGDQNKDPPSLLLFLPKIKVQGVPFYTGFLL